MPAATNRADLIAVTEAEYAKLSCLIAEVPEAQAIVQRDGEASIKDIIGHRAHWIDLFLGWSAAGQRGEVLEIPAKGYKWNQLPAYNAQLREAQAALGWTEVCKMLQAAHARLLTFLAERDNAALYGGPMPGGGSKWTTGRWAEAAGPSHYRSAAKFIRACLREDKGK